MIVSAVPAHLTADSGVAAIAGTRVYPHMLPQGTTAAACTFSIDGDDVAPLIDGEVSSLREALVSIDCYSTVLFTAHQLANNVEVAMAAAQAGGTMGSQEVDSVRLERRFDLFESDTLRYRVSLQFAVAYYP